MCAFNMAFMMIDDGWFCNDIDFRIGGGRFGARSS